MIAICGDLELSQTERFTYFNDFPVFTDLRISLYLQSPGRAQLRDFLCIRIVRPGTYNAMSTASPKHSAWIFPATKNRELFERKPDLANILPSAVLKFDYRNAGDAQRS
jgi:hypothetical protein